MTMATFLMSPRRCGTLALSPTPDTLRPAASAEPGRTRMRRRPARRSPCLDKNLESVSRRCRMTGHPLLYHTRSSPCSAVSEVAPEHVQLERKDGHLPAL